MKRKFLPLLLTVVLVVAAAIVPMLTLTASAAEPVEATISFADTAQRVSQDSDKQVWASGDVKFTNNKAASSTAVGNYSNPVRIYAGSSITFEAPGNITEIVVACSSTSYATALKNSVGSEATASGSDVTITPTGSVTTYTIAKITAQTRFKSVTVTYEAASGGEEGGDTSCEHVWDNGTETVAPGKVTKGEMTYTCTLGCGATKTEDIDPLGCNVTFVVPEGAEAPAAQNGVLKAAMPDAVDAPDNFNMYQYSFAGWAKAAIDGEITEKPELYQPGDEVELDNDTAFYAVYTWSFGDTSNNGWVETDVNEIGSSDIVVMVWTSSKGTHAVTNGNGTGSAPAAVAVTIEGGKITSNVTDNLKWNIVNNSGSLNIHPNGSTSTWLYCTGTNNGVRVGDNAAKAFTIDSSSGYLKHTGTGRYLGIYNAQDLRCYTTSTTTNIANQTVAFYVLVSGGSTFYATTLEAAAACTHDDTTTDTQNATCTESGTITVTCNSCGMIVSVESIDKLGHAYGEGVVTTPATCTKKGVMTFTCENDATHTYTEDIDMLDHNLGSYNVCYDCGYLNATTSGTDYSGTYYVSTTRGDASTWYMTNTLNSGKRYAATTELAEATEVTFVKNEDGTYLIYVLVDGEANYLGWQSENTGIFVSEENAIKFTVVVTNGYYNVYFAAGDGNRYLSLNSTSGSDYFAFYKGTQKQNLTLTPTEAESETPDSYFSGASLALGSTLTLNYYVTIPEGADIADYKVIFTLSNGKVVEVTEAIYDEATGEYKFALTGIAPQNYQVNVSAALYLNNNVVFEKTEYSVETAAMGYLTTKSTAILAQALLEYCVAAADYVDEDDDANYTEDRVIETNPGKSITDNEKVTAVGVNFDYVNKIYVKLNASATVTFNGVAAEVEDLGNGVYIAYSDALTALQFNDTVTIVVDDTTTVTYSINAYAFAKQNADNVEMANLAITLYYYGVAAESYNN